MDTELKIIEYELAYFKKERFRVTIRRFTPRDKPEFWGIVRYGDILSRTHTFNGYYFFFNKDRAFRDEFDTLDVGKSGFNVKFGSAQEALEFWNSKRNRIVATQSERLFALGERDKNK